MQNLLCQMFYAIIESFTPQRLKQSGASIKAIRCGGQHSFPLLDSLQEQVTTHIQSCQASSSEHKMRLPNFYAQLIKFLPNLAIASAEFVGLLIAVQSGVEI